MARGSFWVALFVSFFVLTAFASHPDPSGVPPIRTEQETSNLKPNETDSASSSSSSSVGGHAKLKKRVTFNAKELRSKRPTADAGPQVHPNGRTYARLKHPNVILLSGEPDPWFKQILATEPEHLTLDQVEDMSDLELMDYVGQFIWGMVPDTTNVVKVLRRREAIARKKHRRRPGDEFEEHVPLWDTAGAHDISKIGSFVNAASGVGEGSDAVSHEDLLMSHPRWHLAEDEVHIATDEYYNKRRTERRRPVQDASTASKGKVVETTERKFVRTAASESGEPQEVLSKVKKAVIPTIDLAKYTQMVDGDASDEHKYMPKKSRSNVKRTGLTKLTTREERAKFRARLKLLPQEEQLELHHQMDPGRCYEAAMQFCPGLHSNFAGFVTCVITNLNKFEEHDQHCQHDFPEYYGPCASDMLAHCANLDTFETTACLIKLAKADLQTLDSEGNQGNKDHRKLSNECLASEGMEVMTLNSNEATGQGALSDKEHRIILKYQQFWLSQQQENLEESEKQDYLGRFHLKVKEEHETEYPKTGFGDVFDGDDEF